MKYLTSAPPWKCITVSNPLIQRLSVSLVHFSDQKWNSQSDLLSLHIIWSLALFIKVISLFGTNYKCFGTFMWLIMYSSLLFPTWSIAPVVLIQMYYSGSVEQSHPPKHLQALVHYMNGWTSWSVRHVVCTFLLDLFRPTAGKNTQCVYLM